MTHPNNAPDNNTLQEPNVTVDAPASVSDDAPPAWLGAFQKTVLDSVEALVSSRLNEVAAKIEAPKQPTNESTTPDADAIASRRIAFEKSIESLSKPAQDKMRTLYDRERPSDVAVWAKGYIEAFGLSSQGGTSMNGSNASAAPITGGGVPKTDRSLTGRKSLLEMTAEDVAEMKAKHGKLGAGRIFLKQARSGELEGVQLKFGKRD